MGDVVMVGLPAVGLQHALIIEKPKEAEVHKVRAANVASLSSLIQAPMVQGRGPRRSGREEPR